MLITSATLCLALTIYHEARGEPEAGKKAVGYVVAYRAQRNGTSICVEMVRPKQFSWVRPEQVVRSNGRVVGITADIPPPREWRSALRLAEGVLHKAKYSKLPAYYYFHNILAEPRWRQHMRVAAIIGNHVFYYKETA